ncbi:hypothetical protein TRFO_05925 [Tritrichomonas foetus]|uniref:UBA domain-containing protein n=1 Tax=Tritrichomonas foetus TaxID=1144522 RepID=A0A1J4K6K0_9EUKA|nr:hypothetical protein TRFO_05925 [Tritrichomonas foetus]|eukprot:OHT05348.1 hypothetical protein TRFO_05925 [Tritrichomonas foetus]
MRNLFKKLSKQPNTLSFRNVAGHKIEGTFKYNDTVSTACEYLAKKLNVPPKTIKIINPSTNKTFKNTDKISDHLSDATFLLYRILPEIIKNKSTKNQKNSKNTILNNASSTTSESNSISIQRKNENSDQIENSQQLNNNTENTNTDTNNGNNRDDDETDNHTDLFRLPKSFTDMLSEIQAKPTFRESLIHADYAQSFHLPPDFDEKVEILRQMGFENEECREALRSTNYNVEAAANFLVNNQNRRGGNGDDGVLRLNLIQAFQLMNALFGRNENTTGTLLNALSDREDDVSGMLRELLVRSGQRNNDDGDGVQIIYETHIDEGYENEEDGEEDYFEDMNSLISDRLGTILSLLDEKNGDAIIKLVSNFRQEEGSQFDEEIAFYFKLILEYIEDNGKLPESFVQQIHAVALYYETTNPVDYQYERIAMIDLLNSDIEENPNNPNNPDTNADTNADANDDQKSYSDFSID